MTERWTVVEAAACDGGLQIARIEPWEDCCRAARRYGGTCWHGAAEGGGGATYEECREAIEAEEALRMASPGYDDGSAIRRMIADSIARTAEQ